MYDLDRNPTFLVLSDFNSACLNRQFLKLEESKIHLVVSAIKIENFLTISTSKFQQLCVGFSSSAKILYANMFCTVSRKEN